MLAACHVSTVATSVFLAKYRLWQAQLKYSSDQRKATVDIFTDGFCCPFTPQSRPSLQESPILYKKSLEKLLKFLTGQLKATEVTG